MTPKQLAAAFGLAIVPAVATAQAPTATQPPPWSLGAFYAGASAGGAWHDVDRGRIGRELADLGYTSASVDREDQDFAWKIFGGWQPHPNLAVEVSYFDLGQPRFSATFFRPGELTARLRVTGWSVDLVPQFTFANNWNAFGRVGYTRSNSDLRVSGTGAFAVRETSIDRDHDTWNAGLGLGYVFGPNLVIRGEWTFYSDLGHGDVGGRFDANAVFVSALWRFQ